MNDLDRRWRNLEIWAAMQADERRHAKANRPYWVATLTLIAVFFTALIWYGSTH